MLKLAISPAFMAAFLLAGSLAANAETWVAASAMKKVAESYTPIESVQAKECPAGFRQVCGPSGGCKCVAAH
jgi:hypothetical protein